MEYINDVKIPTGTYYFVSQFKAEIHRSYTRLSLSRIILLESSNFGYFTLFYLGIGQKN